ncbi:YdcF family protein [Kitasatospora sp. NPDC002040]|uniref:YdcF family protein n=1 Tax=Kitasatospora sp. NPDC002040 TaxID=3154661 RepID=UPI00331FB1F5
MIAYALAILLLVLFGQNVRKDRRRFSNAVLLGLAAVFFLLGVLGEFDRLPVRVLDAVVVMTPFAAVLAAVAVGVCLLANGVVMARHEGGGRLANLLSLGAGLAVLGVLALLWTAARVDSRPLHLVAGAVLLPAGYLAFLLLCFLGYSWVYGRLPVRRDVDFVVVLGAGLIDGIRVPPLLASRLDRGFDLCAAQDARGRPPVLVVSGGKGSDEQVPEAVAMADYLTARGLAADRIRLEDRSRNTAENMEFSAAVMSAEREHYHCVVVTNDFHVLRTALITRRAGVPGQVTGSPTPGYYWPSAVLREFVAVLVSYPVTNVCAVLLLALLGGAAGWHG